MCFLILLESTCIIFLFSPQKWIVLFDTSCIPVTIDLKEIHSHINQEECSVECKGTMFENIATI